MSINFPAHIFPLADCLAKQRETLVQARDREIVALGPGMTGEQRRDVLNKWMPSIQAVVRVQVDVWLRFGIFGWKEVSAD